MKRPARHHAPWTAEEHAILRSDYPDMLTSELATRMGRSVKSIYSQVDRLGIRKSDEWLDSPASRRLRRGDNHNPITQFKKGHVPHNKGAQGWQAGGNAHKTQFKKGSKPHNTQPIGAERITKDGYLQRKISATGHINTDWVGVHTLLWIEHHGPFSKGHIVIFKNGNKNDIRIDNLQLITRRENMLRNSIHQYPEPLKQVIRLQKKIHRKIIEVQHHER